MNDTNGKNPPALIVPIALPNARQLLITASDGIAPGSIDIKWQHDGLSAWDAVRLCQHVQTALMDEIGKANAQAQQNMARAAMATPPHLRKN